MFRAIHSIASSLVRIGDTMYAILQIQTKLLALAEEQKLWTRDQLTKIEEGRV